MDGIDFTSSFLAVYPYAVSVFSYVNSTQVALDTKAMLGGLRVKLKRDAAKAVVGHSFARIEIVHDWLNHIVPGPFTPLGSYINSLISDLNISPCYDFPGMPVKLDEIAIHHLIGQR